MGWKLISKPQTVRVTKKIAKEFAEMDPAPHDRPLSERRLQVYQRIFTDGGFRPCTWAKAICEETNGIYRVNGKHTSTFLSGLETLPEYYVTIEDYQCDTLEDVARLYATFDSKMQSRTASDINMSFAATIPELRELPRNRSWQNAAGENPCGCHRRMAAAKMVTALTGGAAGTANGRSDDTGGARGTAD